MPAVAATLFRLRGGRRPHEFRQNKSDRHFQSKSLGGSDLTVADALNLSGSHRFGFISVVSITGADIRIEARYARKLNRTVKTDVNGRYTSDGLPAGTYRVTLVGFRRLPEVVSRVAGSKLMAVEVGRPMPVL
jgi:hypothetical protein